LQAAARALTLGRPRRRNDGGASNDDQWLGWVMRVDDRALRTAAQDLLRQVMRARPVVGLAQHLIDAHPESVAFLVEVRVSSQGPIGSMVLLDHASSDQQEVLWDSQLVAAEA
jgi:hypothetical protein